MRRPWWYIFLAGLCASVAAVTVEDVRSRACEWEHIPPATVSAAVNSTQAICDAQKHRVSCYPASNCVGGRLYGIFLRHWVLECPELEVSEYDAQCSHYMEKFSMSTGTVAIIVGISVTGGLVVMGLGVCLVLYFTRHLRTPVDIPPSPAPRASYVRGAPVAPYGFSQGAWYPTGGAGVGGWASC